MVTQVRRRPHGYT